MTVYRRSALSLLVLASVAAACVGDVGEGKAVAEVADAPKAEEQAKSEERAEVTETRQVDVAQSKVTALGAKVTATHPIVFHEWSGELSLSGTDVVGLELTVQMASLEADHPKLTGHLKTEDFFSVEAFPQATFKSSSVQAKAGEDGATHAVTGDLTIRGQTKTVTFPATLSMDGDTLKADAEFVIDRQDFGVTYPGKPDDLIQDNVVLTINLVAPKA